MTPYMSHVIRSLVDLLESFRDGQDKDETLWLALMTLFTKSFTSDEGGPSITRKTVKLLTYHTSFLGREQATFGRETPHCSDPCLRPTLVPGRQSPLVRMFGQLHSMHGRRYSFEAD